MLRFILLVFVFFTTISIGAESLLAELFKPVYEGSTVRGEYLYRLSLDYIPLIIGLIQMPFLLCFQIKKGVYWVKDMVIVGNLYLFSVFFSIFCLSKGFLFLYSIFVLFFCFKYKA